jgi:mannose-6-phosphate isomerase-like protein (cupin superfamily)
LTDETRVAGEAAPQPAFVRHGDRPPIRRQAEHGGLGEIAFRRLLAAGAFSSAIDFVDASVIMPGSTIGRHQHVQTEELYYIVDGTPIVTVDGDSRRLSRGDVSVVRSGQWHELVNDTAQAVEIFVVQVRV